MAQANIVQDLTTWIPIALSFVTIVVLVFTWWAAKNQANAAREQAKAAEKLIVVTEAQRLSNEQASEGLIAVTDAQRKAAEDAARAAKEQSALIKAQLEESLRPVLVYEEGGGVSTAVPCTLTNQGEGTAFDVVWWYGRAGALTRMDQPVSTSILGPGYSAKITVDQSTVRSKEITVQYRSADGRLYQTFVSYSDHGPIQVQHLVIPG
jgi:hypothetical protein